MFFSLQPQSRQLFMHRQKQPSQQQLQAAIFFSWISELTIPQIITENAASAPGCGTTVTDPLSE